MGNHVPLKVIGDLHWYSDCLVVMEDLPLSREVISLYHNSPTARHPGISNTMKTIAHDYWWPTMKQTVTENVKGCHVPITIVPHTIRQFHPPLHVHSYGLHC
jgi:hypothetical protein